MTDLQREATPSPTAPPVRARGHLPVLDGVRGIAILLVVMAHFGIVWPVQVRPDLGPLQGLFEAGNIGVSIFFVVSGFLVTRSLGLARRRKGWSGPLRTFGRRTLRITLQVYVLLVAILLMVRVDETDKASDSATFNSVRAVATYTWNDYVRNNALNARSDLGALYYLSVELQFYLALVVLVIILWRFPKALITLVAIAIPVVTWWRWYEFQHVGWYQASLLTTTRMDGLLYGVLAALVVHRLPTIKERSAALVGAALLAVVGLVLSCSFGGVELYYGWQGPAIAFAVAVLTMAASWAPDARESLAVRALTFEPLMSLGRASLSIFIWHVWVFQLVARHTTDLSPVERSVLALVLLAVMVVVVQRYVATPVDAWVARLGKPRQRRPGARHSARA